ncbi:MULTISPECIES: 4Fe-4S binding protein [unclassified Nitratiruptor]|uniref:4Fe-4S binding protein n=1 Tax=unclassified Nitratiruptor TaxID=2624044 RepID=UPI00191509FF|nr:MULTISPECIES: 4Fe-4S binding protein [unclassified Nitratiruptor]BCD61094.1 ferredoxin [Nitratiruptor sp. YY08-10]BCD65027.1 ferredoxin [Nitratiruptor sp. YY08-14]
MHYKQTGNHFEIDFLKCLRTDYYHNNCTECIDICPKEAFFFDRGRLTLDVQKCTNCGVCLGICPSEALSLEFFDPNEYILKQQENEVLLSCKKDIPCLSVFDTEHFATFLLRKEKVLCDLSHCEGCELNPDNRTLQSIQERMDEANAFIQALGITKELEEGVYQEDRRTFFKTIFQATKEITQEERLKDMQNEKERLPMKQTLLKNSLKTKLSDIPNTIVPTTFSFLGSKTIDQNCTNCRDCVQFCPTQALFYAKEGTAIWFMSGRCIDCDICNDICKVKVVKDKEQIDIVSWAFDRGEELIEFTFETCSECKTPFVYRGGEPICDRCKDFIARRQDIFKLACDED